MPVISDKKTISSANKDMRGSLASDFHEQGFDPLQPVLLDGKHTNLEAVPESARFKDISLQGYAAFTQK